MKGTRISLVSAALLLVAGRAVGAQIVVAPLAAGSLTLAAPLPGFDVAPVSSAGRYAVRTQANDPRVRIRAQLSFPLPPGTTLSLAMAAPPGAVSTGTQLLSASTPVDVITSIPGDTNASGLPLTYTFSASASSGNLTTLMAAVTFTLAP